MDREAEAFPVIAHRNHEPELAGILRETADAWNERIENWTYVTETDLAQEHGVEGYHVRSRRPGEDGDGAVDGRDARVVRPDALALVRQRVEFTFQWRERV